VTVAIRRLRAAYGSRASAITISLGMDVIGQTDGQITTKIIVSINAKRCTCVNSIDYVGLVNYVTRPGVF